MNREELSLSPSIPMHRLVTWQSPYDSRTYQAPLTPQDEAVLTYAVGADRSPKVLDEYCRLAGMTDWWTLWPPDSQGRPQSSVVN